MKSAFLMNFSNLDCDCFWRSGTICLFSRSIYALSPTLRAYLLSLDMFSRILESQNLCSFFPRVSVAALAFVVSLVTSVIAYFAPKYIVEVAQFSEAVFIYRFINFEIFLPLNYTLCLLVLTDTVIRCCYSRTEIFASV